MEEVKPKLITLPNGSCLRYAMPEDEGNHTEWFKTWDTVTLRSRIKKVTERINKAESPERANEIKKQLPRLGLWSSKSQQHLFVADIDNIPDGFKSWEELRRYCEEIPNCVLAVSPRGKIKVFFLVELEPGLTPSYDLARAFLGKSLAPEVYAKTDDTDTAQHICYLNQTVLEALKSGVCQLTPIQVPKSLLPANTRSRTRSENHSGSLVTPIKTEKTYKNLERYQGDLPDWAVTLTTRKRRLHGKVEKRPGLEEFIRILLATPQLLHGYDLPTKLLGHNCKVNHARVWKWIAELVKAKLLTKMGESDHVSCSNKYKARGALRDSLSEIYRDKPKRLKPFTPVTSIPDGAWEKLKIIPKTVRSIWWRSSSLEDFENKVWAWYNSLPFNPEKDGERRAKIQRMISKCNRDARQNPNKAS